MATFNPKNFNMITASMVNWMANNQKMVTDFNVGGVARTALEAVSLEMEEFYYRTFNSIGASIAEAVYNAFDFPRLPPVAAVGQVVFYRSTPAPADIAIPFGTIAQTSDGKQFSVAITTGKIAAGDTESGLIDVTASDTGSEYNVAANTVQRMGTSVLGVDSGTNLVGTPFPGSPAPCNNTTPISGGTDIESDAARRSRFNLFIQSLSRGTLGSLEFAALNVAQVETAKAMDNQDVFALVYEPGASFNAGSATDFSLLANTPHEQDFRMLDVPGMMPSFFIAASATQFDALYVDLSQPGVDGGTPGKWYYLSSANPMAWDELDPFGRRFTISTDPDGFSIPAPGQYYIYLDIALGDVREWFPYGGSISVAGSTSNDGVYTIAQVGYGTRTWVRVVEVVVAEAGLGDVVLSVDGTNGLTKSGAVYFDPSLLSPTWKNIKFLDGDVGGAENRTLFPIMFRDDAASYTSNPICIELFTRPEPGYAHLFCSGANAVLTADVKAQVEASILNYRAAGIKVRVFGPTKRLVEFTAGIRVSGAFEPNSVKDLVTQGVAAYTSDFALGQSIYVSGLIAYIMGLQTDAILDVEITSLDGNAVISDVVAAPNEMLLMGSVTINLL
jgi:hypothetical protein